MLGTTTIENGQAVSDENEQNPVDRDTLFKELSDSLDANIFLFSGPLERHQANLFLNTAERVTPRTNVALILCTLGGDADAAYIIARYLKRTYKKFTVYVFGHCKSAGTLIALGADEIVMSSRGELGPLDVQLLKADDLMFRGSGLDIEEAIKSLSNQAFDIFEKHFLGVIKRGGGVITTKTAADIASALAVGLIAPITGQIDPLHIGEVKRATNIAYEYGVRLNNDENRINRLVSSYPSHSFVIDYNEAEEIFGNVRQPIEAEINLERILHKVVDDQGHKLLRYPHPEGVIAHLKPRKVATNEKEREQEEEPDVHTSRDRALPVEPATVNNSRPNGNSNRKSKKDAAQSPAETSQIPEKAESVNSKNG